VGKPENACGIDKFVIDELGAASSRKRDRPPTPREFYRTAAEYGKQRPLLNRRLKEPNAIKPSKLRMNVDGSGTAEVGGP
jgi:hypothetical protein